MQENKQRCVQRPKTFRVYNEPDGSLTIKYRCPMSNRNWVKMSVASVDELREALERVPKG